MSEQKQLAPAGEMSFIEHLEALRWHIFRSLMAVGIVMVIMFILGPTVFDYIIFGPKEAWFLTYKGFCEFSRLIGLGDMMCLTPTPFEIVNIDMMGQFLAHLKVSIVLGFAVAFPYVFWEIWRFIEPALYDDEVKYTRGIVFITSLLFTVGALFGYFVLCPFSINFFAGYSISETIKNTITLSSYVGIVTTLVMASGIMFELPMVVYFLSKIGILTPEMMREYRKHAFVVILVIAAAITPADVWTQILVSVPVYFLYEISILVSARVVKNAELEEERQSLTTLP